MNTSNYLIQNIFKCNEKYLSSCKHPLKNIKAINAIIQCRTPAMGTGIYRCDEQHAPIEIHHSCRHRSCFICAAKSRKEWIDKQCNRLFDTPHFHVVFTLPHEYLSLWRYNDALFTSLIFKASHETLVELMADVKYHGVTPGILMALHTWGRQLTLHPHTHCLVTAGGLTPAGEWKTIDDYLLPIRVVKALYRGKMQALIMQAFKQGDLTLPPDMRDANFLVLHKTAYAKEWSVRIEERYAHGKGVLLYLARYFKGGPIDPKQIECCTAKEIVFRYLDHRDKRVKPLRLSPESFIHRLLDHVPSMGTHTVRHYGLYASSSKARRERCYALLGGIKGSDKTTGESIRTMLIFCKQCGQLARHTHSLWRNSKGISYIREGASGFVQQVDEQFIANPLRSRDYCQLQV